MEKSIQIEGKAIGAGRTYVIAEVGSNHCQDLTLAFETIDAAADAGVDAVKFQSLRVDRLYDNPAPAIQDLHRLIDLREEWHEELQVHCAKRGVTFFSSPTYLEAVDLMEALGVPLYKIASAQAGTFPQLIEKVAKTGKPVILSTGLLDYAELSRVVDIFRSVGNRNLIVLHCNSLYPTPADRVNLPLIAVYSRMFDCITGFSDHTLGSHVSLGAVALGAAVIEKHFTLRRNLPSPDAPFALEPGELRQLIADIRELSAALQFTPRIGLEPEEASFRDRILYKPFASRAFAPGDSISPSDVFFRRTPRGALEARDIYESAIKADHRYAAGDLIDQ